MDKYVVVIILTTIGFFALAAILLIPVWRFLVREEKISKEWTQELIRAQDMSEAAPDSVNENPPVDER